MIIHSAINQRISGRENPCQVIIRIRKIEDELLETATEGRPILWKGDCAGEKRREEEKEFLLFLFFHSFSRSKICSREGTL